MHSNNQVNDNRTKNSFIGHTTTAVILYYFIVLLSFKLNIRRLYEYKILSKP